MVHTLIPAVRRGRKEDQKFKYSSKFKASLGYIRLSQKEKKKKKCPDKGRKNS